MLPVALQVAKKQKQLREERLELMRKKVKEEFGRELEITYDNDAVDESDEELLALEADAVKDQNDLPGEDLKEILNLSQPEGRDPSPLPLNQLAPIPTKDALFGDVKKKITEYEDARDALQKRNLMMREKQELALQEKLRLRQQNGRRTRKQRRKSTIVPLAPMIEDESSDGATPTPKSPKKKKASPSPPAGG
ncbi:Protein W03G9.7 [Aphelenchoides avenae]|nr:Protein W03G9.7 [Aphelenchus avenae]